MTDYFAKYKHVRRNIFNNVADRIESIDELRSRITVYYNGSNLYGEVTIEGQPGYSAEYKKALAIFVEEYCK
ncbi:MAG: hypothetical protein HFH39_04195 [Lachnospiraceae bacterium]|nr:hypothetical protein [Lachnospiraceae bacterium]